MAEQRPDPNLIQRIASALGLGDIASEPPSAEGPQTPWPVLDASPLVPAPPPAPPPAPEPTPVPEAVVAPPTLPDIAIDGKAYPCDEWALAEEGERLEQVWDKGFRRGMGQYRGDDPERYYYAENFDTSMPPYVRLGVGPAASYLTLTGFDSSNPFFAILIESPDGTDFVYLFSGQRGYKIKLSDDTVNDTHDFGAGAVCGRPALFEGNWYIPLGATVDAVELTTIADTGADTFNTLNVKALAFANLMKDGIAQLARAHTTNLVDLTAAVTRAASDWAGDDFEVGDSSLAITDMLTWKNELAIIKPDSVYRFDADGTASSIQGFVGRNLSPLVSSEGEGFVLGAYFYWQHSSGLWRIVDDAALPIGPEAAAEYIGINEAASFLDSVHPPDQFQWKSAAAWGKWFYACTALNAFYGEIVRDGEVLWHGSLPVRAGASERLAITEGGTTGATGHPLLWIADTSNDVYMVELQPDGSIRSGLSSGQDERGPTNTTSKLFTSRTDLAGGRMRQKEKQLRRVWARTEEGSSGGWTANVPLQLRVIRDNVVAGEDVGSTITSSGFSERFPTPGTNDLFYEIRLELEVVLAGFAAGDARILDFGIEAVTASVYRIVIPLLPGRIAGNRGLRGMLKDLRNLKSGATVKFRDPENPTADFDAQIVSVAEEAVPVGVGQVGYILQVHFERFSWDDAV